MLGIRRRKFISFLGGAAAWPVVAWAQQARHVPTIGYVAPTNPLMPSRSTGAFLQRLRELVPLHSDYDSLVWASRRVAGCG